MLELNIHIKVSKASSYTEFLIALTKATVKLAYSGWERLETGQVRRSLQKMYLP